MDGNRTAKISQECSDEATERSKAICGSLVDSFLQETNLHVLLGITREEILWGLITVRPYSLRPSCPVKPIYVAFALYSR